MSNRLRKLYENIRNNILLSIKSQDRNEEIDKNGDMFDEIQATSIAKLSAKLSDRDLARLEKLNKSIEKMDNGTFGICEECEEKISEKRLEAIPGVSLCISCAEAAEMSKR
jgi:DnaK suppressor protein